MKIIKDLTIQEAEDIQRGLEDVALQIAKEIRNKYSDQSAPKGVECETDNYLEEITSKQLLGDLWLYDKLLEYVKEYLDNDIITRPQK